MMFSRIKRKSRQWLNRGRLPMPPYPDARADSPIFPDDIHVSRGGIPYRLPEASSIHRNDDSNLFARLQANLDEARNAQDALLADMGMKRKGDQLDSILIESIDFDAEQKLLLEMSDKGIEQYEDKMLCQSYTDDHLGDWPQRLLHIPTMTSLEWQPGNIYGIHREPTYAALSYTWGRYRVTKEDLEKAIEPFPALTVLGISWEIPPIKESVFSATQFEDVLKIATSSSDTDFIWLDVACIDQRDGSEAGAREIGRQAKIFGRAIKAFIWLLAPEVDDRTHRKSLEQILSELYKTSKQAKGCENAGGEQADHAIWMRNSPLSDLTLIPWWSSLWTLQEAFMRPDAVLLDTHGRTVVTADGQPETLSGVLQHVSFTYDLCQRVTRANRFNHNRDRMDALVEGGFIRIVERSGLQALAQMNPLLLYTCAKVRETERPLDRVYGIMQIWGFRLGKAAVDAQPDDSGRTLTQLEIELGIELVRVFPIESQLHVHTASIAGRQSWRISDSSTVPSFVTTLSFDHSGHLAGRVNTHNTVLGVRQVNNIVYGTFSGHALPFNDFVEAVTKSNQDSSLELNVNVALDQNPIFNTGTLQSKCNLQEIPEDRKIEITQLISSKASELHRRLVLVLLGSVLNDEKPQTAFGMIVMEVADACVGRWWKRIGICSWDASGFTPSNEGHDLPGSANPLILSSSGLRHWRHLSGLFG